MSLLEVDYVAFWGGVRRSSVGRARLSSPCSWCWSVWLRGAPARLRCYLWWIGLLKLMLPVSRAGTVGS